MTISIREMISGFSDLGIPAGVPVLAHVSLIAAGDIELGPKPLLAALTRSFGTLLMPAFTFKCEVMPDDQPTAHDACYAAALNRQAVVWDANLAADRNLGVAAEAFRRLPDVARSDHPLLSFSGLHAGALLDAQTRENPWAVIEKMILQNGWVLLVGADQRKNVSLHYASKLVEQALPTRWAKTHADPLACPQMPGCSRGFHKADAMLKEIAQELYIGDAKVRAYPLVRMMTILKASLTGGQPDGLRCDFSNCRWCRRDKQE